MTSKLHLHGRLGLDLDEQLPSFTELGGYPIVYVSDDGQEWCPSCANQVDAEPPVTDFFIHYEGEPVTCSGGCGNVIESAYGDPYEDERHRSATR